MKKRSSWPIATASLLALLSLFSLSDLAVAQQQQPAGVVTGIQGQAQVTRPAAKPSPLRFRDGVIIRDVVDTREKSLARILFGGRSTVTVRELSRLQVTEEILPSGARRDVHDLSSGAILVNVARQLMKPGDEVHIRTPNAVAAVRGSTVFGSFNPALNQSFFAILSGSGTVTPQGLPPVSLSANTSNNGANVSGSGPAVQVTVINVPPAQANQIIAESQVAKVVTEEANKEQIVQAAVQESAALVTAVVEAVTQTEQTTGETKTEEQKQEEQQQEASTAGETTTETTEAPVTSETPTTTPDNPDVAVSNTTKTLQGDETLKTFTGTGDRSGTSPVVKIDNSTVDRASTGNLVQVDSGADWTISSPVLDITNSTITDSSLLAVSGALKGTGTDPFINVDPSTITTPINLGIIGVGSGGSLTIEGPLFKDVGGTITSGNDFLAISGGGQLTGNSTSPLLQFQNSNVTVGTDSTDTHFFQVAGSGSQATLKGPLVNATDSTFDIKGFAALEVMSGGTVDSTTTSPFVDLTGGSLTLGSNVYGLFMDSGTMNVSGSLFKFDGTTVSSVSTNPFAQLTNSTLSIGTDFLAMDGGSLDTSGALLKITGGSLTLGASSLMKLTGGASLTAAGSLLDMTDLDLDLGTSPVARLEGGSTLKNTAGPVIKISGGSLTADSLASTDGAGNKFELTGSLLDLSNNTTVTLSAIHSEPEGSTDTTTFSLGINEPFINVVDSTLKLTGSGEHLVSFGVDSGDPVSQGGVGLIASGSTIEVAGPLLDLGGVNLTDTNPQIQLSGGTTVTQTGSNSLIEVSGLAVTTEGSLFKSTDSTISTDAHLLLVEGSLTGNSTDPLIQLTSATLSAGDHFLHVGTDGSVSVAGPVLSATGGSLTATDDFFFIEPGSTFTSTTPSAVLQFTGGAVVESSNDDLVDVEGTATLGGPLLSVTGSTITAINLVEVDGSLTNSSSEPLIQLTNSTLSIGTDLIDMDGGSLDTSGALLKITGGTLTLGASSLTKLTEGASLTAGGSLLDMTDLDLDLGTSPLARLEGGSTLKNTAGPVIKISGGSLTADSLASTDGAGNKFELTGSLLDLSNSTTVTLNAINSEPEGSTDTSTFSLGANEPFINVVDSTLKLTGSGEHLVSFGVDSGDPVSQGGVGLIASGSTIEVAGPLLDLGGVNLTDTNPQIQLSNSTTVTQSGTDPLIIVTGLDVTTAGPLLKATDSTIDAGGTVLDIQGSLSSSTNQALISLDPTTISTSSDFIHIGSSGSLSLEGQLVTDSGGTLTAAGNFLAITSGGTLTSNTLSPLLQFTNSNLTVGTDASETHFFQVAGSGSQATLKGPLVSATGSSFDIKGFAALEVFSGGTVDSTTTSPFVDLTGGSLTLGTNVHALAMSSGTMTLSGPLFKADTTIITPGSGVPFIKLANSSSLTTGGPFLDLTNVDLDLGTEVLARLEGGSTLKNTAGPVIKITGGSFKADALGTTDGAGNKFELTGTLLDLTDTTVTLRTLGEDPDSSTDTTTFTLAANEPWIKMTNSTLELTGTTDNVLIELNPDDFGATFNGIALIATDSTLTLPTGLMDMEGVFSSTSTSPLVQLTNTTVTSTGALIAVEPGSTTDISLAGQLLKASGSTIKVKNEDVNTVTNTLAVGTKPFDAAFAGDRAYVVNFNSGTVSIINVRTNTVESTLTVGSLPTSIAREGSDIYVVNAGDNTVSRIDAITRTVTDTITVGSEPRDVTILPNGDKAYVTNFSGDTVSVIRTSDNTVIATINVGDGPEGIDFSPDGKKIGVLNQNAGTVSIIDTSTDTVTATITVGTKPVDGAFTLAGDKAYIVNKDSDNVSVINVATNSKIKDISVGDGPDSIAITPDSKKAYVGNEFSDTVSVIDIATDTVVATISVGDEPDSIAISRDGKRAYVTNFASNTVKVIDTESDTVIATVNVGTGPGTIALTRGGTIAFVLNEDSNNVSVIDTVDLGNFLEITGGAILKSTTTLPLLEFNPSTLELGGDLVRITGAGSKLDLAGPLVSAEDTTFDVFRILTVRDGGVLTSSTTEPLMKFVGTAADKSKVDTLLELAAIDQLNTTDKAPQVTLAGPFLEAINTTFTAGKNSIDKDTFIRVAEGGLLKSTGTDPLILISFDGSTLDPAFKFLDIASPDSAGTGAKVEVAGPLLSATNSSSFTTQGDFISVRDKGTLKGTGITPLIQTSSSTFTIGSELKGFGSFLRLDDHTTVSSNGGGTVDLAGPLFKDTGSTFDIFTRFLYITGGSTLTSTSTSADPLLRFTDSTVDTDRNFVGVFETSTLETKALLTATNTDFTAGESTNDNSFLFVGSSATLKGTGTDPFVIFETGSTLDTAGNFLTIRDSNSSTAPSTVSLAGPLLKATDGTFTTASCCSFLFLGEGGKLEGTGTGALFQLTNNSFDVGGDFVTLRDSSPTTAKMDIKGALVSDSGSTFTIGSRFLRVRDGSTLTSTTTDPLISFSGSTVDTKNDFIMIDDSGSKVTLSGSLLSAGSTLNIGTDATGFDDLLDIRDGGQLVMNSSSPVVEFTGGTLTISGASSNLVSVNGGRLITEGDLLKVSGGATVNINDGALVNASSGGLALIKGAGANIVSGTVNVSNATSSTDTIFSVPVSRTNGGFISIGPNSGLEDVTVASSVIVADGAGTLISIDPLMLPTGPFITIDVGRTLGSTGLASFTIGTTPTAEPILAETNPAGTVTVTAADDTAQGGLQGQGIAQLTGSTISISGATVDGASCCTDLITVSGTSLAIPGPLLQITNSTLDNTGGSGDLIRVDSGSILKTYSTEQLIKIDSSTVSIGGRFLLLGGILSLSGPFLSATASDLTASSCCPDGSFLQVDSGGTLTSTTNLPLVTLDGGTHTFECTDCTSHMFSLAGSSTAVDSESGLGTDKPIQTGGVLFEAKGGATVNVNTGSAIKLDTALYEATAPILELLGSTTTETTLTTAGTTMDIFKSKVVSNGPLVAMDKSFINVTDGPFIHIRNGSLVDVTGDLLRLFNGAKIEVINGPLIKVEGTSGGGSSPAVSELKVSGALVEFGGSGNNKIIVNNSITLTGTISGIKVAEGSTGSITIGSNPVKENGVSKPLSSATLGSITQNGVVIQTGTTGKVNITAP